MEKSLFAETFNVSVVEWVADAPVPVTLTANEPARVDPLVAIVSVELDPDVTAAGLKDAVVPAGSPPAARFTVCGEPLVTAVVIVDVLVWPWVTERLEGATVREKSLVADTFNVNVVACVADVPVPVTVTGYEPAGVDTAVARVSVELPPLVTAVGANDAVAPAGRPLAVRFTVWDEPFVTVVDIVDVALWPAVTPSVDGPAAIEKSSAGVEPVNV
jgi:hypothetical protein